MIQLNLTEKERLTFLDILEYELKELINEISNTENWEFKKGLKEKKELLNKLISAIKSVS